MPIQLGIHVPRHPSSAAWRNGPLGGFFNDASYGMGVLDQAGNILGVVVNQVRATTEGARHLLSSSDDPNHFNPVTGLHNNGHHAQEGPGHRHGGAPMGRRPVTGHQAGDRDPNRQFDQNGQPIGPVPEGASFYRVGGQAPASQTPQQDGGRDRRRQYGADGQPISPVPEGATFYRVNNQAPQNTETAFSPQPVPDDLLVALGLPAAQAVAPASATQENSVGAPETAANFDELNADRANDITRRLNTAPPAGVVRATQQAGGAIAAADFGTPIATDVTAPASNTVAPAAGGFTMPANGTALNQAMLNNLSKEGIHYTSVGQGNNAVEVFMQNGRVVGGYSNGTFTSLESVQPRLAEVGKTIEEIESVANASQQASLQSNVNSPTAVSYASLNPTQTPSPTTPPMANG